MQFDWTTLGVKAPTALVKARNVAHHAAQWPTKAARANLEAKTDDSHSAYTWDADRGVLFSQPMPGRDAEVRVGLRLSGLALVLMRGKLVLDTYELAGRRDSMVGVWLDSALRALGVKPTTDVELPYTIPSHPVARGSAYSFSGESESFEELVRWFSAGAELLEEAKTFGGHGASDVLCWPHHFDLGMVIALDPPGAEKQRSIGVGLSPGDHYYPQPYFYVNPYPAQKGAAPQTPLPLGHWHTDGFTGAVALGESIVRSEDGRGDVRQFLRAAFDACCAHLGYVAAEQRQPQQEQQAAEDQPIAEEQHAAAERESTEEPTVAEEQHAAAEQESMEESSPADEQQAAGDQQSTEEQR